MICLRSRLFHWKTMGMSPQFQPQLPQVVPEVLEALFVGVQHGRLAVSHEDNAIYTLEHQLAGGVIEDLARHGIELELGP